MLTWWFLIGSLALGWFIVSLFGEGWKWWVCASLALILGFLTTAWLSFLLAFAFHSTANGVAATNLLLLFPTGWALWGIWQKRARLDQMAARTGVIAICLAPILAMFWLHSPYTDSLAGISAHGYSWGDMPLHMTLASFFAQSPRPILELPLLPHTALTYPFLIDWQAGVLRSLGANWIMAITVPGTLLFGAACALSIELVRRLAGTARAARLHLVIFLGLGSAAGIIPLVRDFFAGRPIWLTDYSNISSQNLSLASPITSHFLPQRSFLFGFAIVMALIVIIYDLVETKKWKLLVIPSIGLGLLPFAHVHAAIVSMAWWLVVALVVLWQHKASRLWVSVSLLLMLGVAIPQLHWQFSALPAGFGMSKIGWMWNGEGTLAGYWWRQLGLIIPLALAGFYLIRTRLQNSFLTVGLVGGIGLLLAGNLRLFHPSDFDNLKFMLYGFWIVLIPMAYALDRLSRTKIKLLVPLIVLICALVGVHTVIRDVLPSTGYQFFTQDDILAAQDLQGIIPPNATVATQERHNNVIAALVGRRVLAGYSGWLWSYGLTYAPALDMQKGIIQGNDNGSFVVQDNVSFIAVHAGFGEDLDANIERLRALYPLVYNNHDWLVFGTGVVPAS